MVSRWILLISRSARARRGLEEVVEKTGDGEGADAADDRGDGTEVGACSDAVCDVAFEDAAF